MVSWEQFAAASPELAAFGLERLTGRVAYLATTRADNSPRVHPVSPFLTSGRLVLYMEPTSPKRHDLLRDARYALHSGVEDNDGGGGEFLIRGIAREINDSTTRARADEEARSMGHNPRQRYVLFELAIEQAMATVYEDDEPKRTRWKDA
jgi:hypothetical protein